MPAAERQRLLEFYANALRRHLYVHGPDKRLLSKNAAFAPLANSLARTFPDARFLVCLRDPVQTVPSQLSSIQDGLAFFGVPADSAPIRERFIEQLVFYYTNLRDLAEHGAPGRTVTKTLPQLKSDLAGSVRDAYRQLGIPLSPDFAATLAEAAAPAKAYRSGHRYELAQFGLDADAIARRFVDAYAHPALAATGVGDAEVDITAAAADSATRGSPPAAAPVPVSLRAGGLS
jgi:hypothetical protein